MNNEIQIRFGRILRELRKQAGLSQEEFADTAGLHRTYIGDIERGRRNISLINIQKVANGLGMRISEIFKDLEKLDET